eukprot:CAMPEP_0181179708 /NCGR_PEP_ID=MMETSP1096-20121128/6406_1 /TAXON_ID=156174 ORGANISM="Chrysochromulina ericina, Strain CCMP281" /NCGR_SAMPLE_ID=MMETSP1096 /ASSEMBLY_ACC=CAM_ASM_000453 /LENGTH=38 /DNA_ID= /DNA_START= /DNA_END= /DNA_ORIENTATION=
MQRVGQALARHQNVSTANNRTADKVTKATNKATLPTQE